MWTAIYKWTLVCFIEVTVTSQRLYTNVFNLPGHTDYKTIFICGIVFDKFFIFMSSAVLINQFNRREDFRPQQVPVLFRPQKYQYSILHPHTHTHAHKCTHARMHTCIKIHTHMPANTHTHTSTLTFAYR